MFEVKPYKIKRNLHEIVANFRSIIHDGENDILYVGTNTLGNKILGAIIFEDDENEYLSYFHILLSDEEYYSFLKGKVSLRSILENAGDVFIVDKKYNGIITDYNFISVEEIPSVYLPLENSFCPDFVYPASQDYIFSLKGGLADNHKAEPEVMNEMNIKFRDFIRSSSSFLDSLDIDSHIYSEPAMTGSFELNFRIDLKERQSLFSRPYADVQNFLLKLYKFIFNGLPQEEAGSLKAENITSEAFNEIRADYSNIFKQREKTTKTDDEQEVIDLIAYSVKNLKELRYEGFDRIEVMNKLQDGEKLPVAVINENFYKSVENKLFDTEQEKKPDIEEYDNGNVSYAVQVYSLNKETGYGKVSVKEKDGVLRISIYLKGRNNYQNTIFTKNMDEESPTMMTIKAKGYRVNGELKNLTYTFDE